MRCSTLALLLTALLLLGASSSEALTICAGPCPPEPTPPPDPVIEIDPIDLPPLPLPFIEVLVPGGEDFVFEWGHDLRVRVPVGGTFLERLTLSAVGEILVASDVSIFATDAISLCAGPVSCVSDPESLPGGSALGAALPASGQNVTLVSGGDITVVVPEPRPAGLALVGALGLLVAGRRRGPGLPA
jgi:hypothetical protein